MRQDPRQREASAALTTGQPAGAAAGHPDTAIPFPRLAPLSARLALPRPSLQAWRVIGACALAGLLSGTLLVVLVASAAPSALVPRSSISFPGWFAGPLHGLLSGLVVRFATINTGLSIVIVALAVAYCLVLGAARALGTRTIVICVVALHVMLLMSPPLQLTDTFNYLGYARLGALHGLNPYTHVIAQASHDPVHQFSTWYRLRSPYGPLFTAATYPLAFLPLSVAYWVLKIATVLASLAFLALVWSCARRLGRDPRLAVAFVAFNPIYLIYALGGFHNDFFMLVPSIGAVALLLMRRDRAAGAALMAAVAIKFTAVLLLPFLLLAAPSLRRRAHVLAGVALAAVPLVALSVALFGFTLPNLSDQSALLTNYSIPNLVGDALGAGGGAPWLLHIADLAVVLSVAWLLVRHRGWISGAGWATLALIASLSWLVPWYIVWLLPLAALGNSPRLRRATLALTAFLVLTFLPVTGIFLSTHGVNTMRGPAGRASWVRQRALEY
jgi:hypothetical protein